MWYVNVFEVPFVGTTFTSFILTMWYVNLGTTNISLSYHLVLY